MVRSPWLLWPLMVLLLVACERELSDNPPPLRPLVYTEAQPQEDTQSEIVVVKAEHRQATELGEALFEAIVEHDREGYEALFVTGPELVALVRTSEEKGAAQAQKILEKSEATWALTLPAQISEEPAGGLTERFELLQVELGHGRNLAGKLTQEDEEIVQHWGNELHLKLREGDKTFSLRMPKIVLTINGWKIAEPIQLEPTLALYLEAGMHLKDELLTSEHYAYPLEVGNYWKYAIEGDMPALRAKQQEALDSSDVIEPPVDIKATVKYSVTEVLRGHGYLVAIMERDFFYGEHEVSTERYLVMPKRIYPCTRDCAANVDDIAYLLGYASKQVPVFSFPLEPGVGWDKNGRSQGARNRYKVKPEVAPLTQVPAGDFSDALVIVGSVNEGREERYFVPGTGVVQRHVRSGSGAWFERLLDYRLML